MAQLDTASFLPQVFWLMVVFTVFYLIVQKNVIPTISTILKVRAKLLGAAGGQSAGTIGSESPSYDILLQKSLKEAGDWLQKGSQGGSSWAQTESHAMTGKGSAGAAEMKAVGELVAQAELAKALLVGKAA